MQFYSNERERNVKTKPKGKQLDISFKPAELHVVAKSTNLTKNAKDSITGKTTIIVSINFSFLAFRWRRYHTSLFRTFSVQLVESTICLYC